jgi:hypothetical protein
MQHVKHEMLTLEHLDSSPVFSGVIEDEQTVQWSKENDL